VALETDGDHQLDRSVQKLRRVKEGKNILQTIKRRECNWIGYILFRNYLQKHVIEGKVELRTDVTRKRGRRRKQLLHGLKDKR